MCEFSMILFETESYTYATLASLPSIIITKKVSENAIRKYTRQNDTLVFRSFINFICTTCTVLYLLYLATFAHSSEPARSPDREREGTLLISRSLIIDDNNGHLYVFDSVAQSPRLRFTRASLIEVPNACNRLSQLFQISSLIANCVVNGCPSEAMLQRRAEMMRRLKALASSCFEILARLYISNRTSVT